MNKNELLTMRMFCVYIYIVVLNRFFFTTSSAAIYFDMYPWYPCTFFEKKSYDEWWWRKVFFFVVFNDPRSRTVEWEWMNDWCQMNVCNDSTSYRKKNKCDLVSWNPIIKVKKCVHQQKKIAHRRDIDDDSKLYIHESFIFNILSDPFLFFGKHNSVHVKYIWSHVTRVFYEVEQNVELLLIHCAHASYISIP